MQMSLSYSSLITALNVEHFTMRPEPNRGWHPKGACSLNGGQTQLRDYSQRVPEAGSSGENRGG